MTVSKTVSTVVRYGNGVTNQFTFPFSAATVGDIYVAKVLPSGYLEEIPRANYSTTISNSSESGAVTLNFIPEDQAPIYIWRETKQTQDVTITNQTSYNPSVVMQVWNKLTRMIQEVKSDVDRAVKIPPGTDDQDGTLSVELANSILTLAPIASDIESVAAVWQDIVTVSEHSIEVSTVAEHITAVIAANGSAIQATGEAFVATAGQTDFILSNDVFSEYNLLVKKNKLLLHPVADYTAVGRSLTLSEACEAGDDIEVVNIGIVSMNEIRNLRDQVVQSWSDVAARHAAITSMNDNINIKNQNVNDRHADVVTKHNQIVQMESDIIGYKDAAQASAGAASDAAVQTGEDAIATAADRQASGISADEADQARQDAVAAAGSVAGAAVPLGATFWLDCLRGNVPDGYVARDGQLISRTFAPEFFAALQLGVYPVVTEAEWWDGTANRGKYTMGTDGTNFRIPDDNGKQTGSKCPFVRGDGYDTSIGKVVGDAIRNISGAGILRWGAELGGTGPFYTTSSTDTGDQLTVSAGTQPRRNLNFDASRVVPTADENRPVFVVRLSVMKIRGATLASLLPNPPATLGSNVFIGDQRVTGDIIATRFAAGSGGVSSEGPLNVSGISNLRGNTAVTGTLSSTGRGNFAGADINGTLSVTGTTNLGGNLTTRSINVNGNGNAFVELRSSAGESYIDFTNNGETRDYHWRVIAQNDGNFKFNGFNGAGFTFQTDGNIWTSGLGWLTNRFADRGALIQYQNALIEFGSVQIMTTMTADAPSPYVLVGLRTSQFEENRVFLRARPLQNN